MAKKDLDNVVFWGIHGGKYGEADSIFLKKNQIALGWPDMGDLTALQPKRPAFKARMIETYPGRKPGYYPNVAGQLYRLIHEMKEGDYVIYPSKQSKRVHIGEVVGPYKFIEKNAGHYPHRRQVKWINDFSRTKFSQGALYEIGSAMTFFQVKNYADEFLAAVTGQEIPVEPDTDETVSYVAEDIEQNTVDFILKKLAQDLKGHALAEFVAQLLGTMGYRTRVAPPGPDGGVDIIAHKDELGFVPPIIKVQVKSTEGSVGDPIVSQLIGKLEQGEYGMVVTLGSFTTQARNTSKNKSNLRLIDGEELVKLVLQHYDQFESKYKGMIPLKRVYVPEAIEDAG